jgi:hypothetical protein
VPRGVKTPRRRNSRGSQLACQSFDSKITLVVRHEVIASAFSALRYKPPIGRSLIPELEPTTLKSCGERGAESDVMHAPPCVSVVNEIQLVGDELRGGLSWHTHAR